MINSIAVINLTMICKASMRFILLLILQQAADQELVFSDEDWAIIVPRLHLGDDMNLFLHQLSKYYF